MYASKIVVLLFEFFLLVPELACAQDAAYFKLESFSEGLISVQINNKFGYIDKTGKLAIDPKFDWADGFADGVASAKLNGKMGSIDKAGNWVIPPKFDFVGKFSEGLASASLDKKWGYIDKTGNWVVQPEFKVIDGNIDGLYQFSKGMAKVCQYYQNQKDFRCGYIDRTGAWVINPRFGFIWDFSEEYALACESRSDLCLTGAGKYGYVDKCVFRAIMNKDCTGS